jgi:hypothetical protein
MLISIHSGIRNKSVSDELEGPCAVLGGAGGNIRPGLVSTIDHCMNISLPGVGLLVYLAGYVKPRWTHVYRRDDHFYRHGEQQQRPPDGDEHRSVRKRVLRCAEYEADDRGEQPDGELDPLSSS